MNRPTTFSTQEKARDNGSGAQLPASGLCLHEQFEEWVDRSPDRVAIWGLSETTSFGVLDAKANRVAHALLRLGLGPEEPVGVLVDRSADLPLAALAILKAGGCYVPLLADLPPARLANMAQQAGMRQIIALDELEPPAELCAALAERTGKRLSVLRIAQVLGAARAGDERRPSLAMRPGRLAAILFTSGSTGLPKGVLLQHDACTDMATGHAHAQGIVASDRVLFSSSPGFILGFRELFLPMALGCSWVPADREQLEQPAELIASIERRGVTVALLTPSYLRLFNRTKIAGLRMLLTAGERPNGEDARFYARHLTYWNLHGATEVCGTFCMHQVLPDSAGDLPSGRPFPNTTIVLLDENGELVPSGGEGEIYVISPRVSRGYLNQPELTSENFVETRFGRAYRTHDLGRWTADGELLSLGRSGDIVKVSGQSVSLGEVEHALLDQGEVRAAAIIQHRDRLIAFAEPIPGRNIADFDWNAFLGQRLPAYMVPARVLNIGIVPVSSAGKVDRLALMELAEQDWHSRRASGGPAKGPIEQAIAAAWSDVLGLDPWEIGRLDNFHLLGGSSLLAIKVGQNLQAAGLAVNVRDILSSLNIAALAELLGVRSQEAADALALDNGQPVAATAGQTDFWVAAALGLPASGSHVWRMLRLTGGHLSAEDWRAVWTKLVRRHAALRTGLVSQADGALMLFALADSDPQLAIPFDVTDVADEPAAASFMRAQINAPFDLSRPPLARAGLVRIADGQDEFFWFVAHHAMVDGMSATQIQQDLLAVLDGVQLAAAIDGPRIASRTELAHLASPQAEVDRDYWQALLDGLANGEGSNAFEALPFERPTAGADADNAGEPMVRPLDPSTTQRLTRLANAQGAGLHALLLALLAAEAGRRSNRSHVIVGSGISTRPAGAEEQIGHFVNLLPLPLAGMSELPLSERLHNAQAAVTGAVTHGLYPARLISLELGQRNPGLRDPGRLGLADIALTANPARLTETPGSGLALCPVALPGVTVTPAAGMTLSFAHEPTTDGGTVLSLVWNPATVGQIEAEAWLEALAAWSGWLAEEPGRLDVPLPDLLPSELAWLSTVETGPRRTRIQQPAHRLVEGIVDQYPDRPAVVTRSQTISYGEVEKRANRIAASLISRSLTPGEPVAVLAENGLWLAPAILGVWKAGGVYVPLTSEMPTERARGILEDSGAQHLLVLPETELSPELAAGRFVLHPETLGGDPPRPDVEVPADAPAYIIFTSGTTGTPKGTIVRHDGMINAVLCTLEAVGQHADDRIAVMATPSFDASLWELGMALFHGLPMVPINNAQREDPWSMKDLFGDLGVTISFQAPSYLRVSQDKPFDPNMRVLLVGGEAPSHSDVARYPDIDFWNPYGPTETSIIVSLGRIPTGYAADQPLHVGQPMANAMISIRRSDGSRVPPGCSGEVWLGGVGVCVGYLNNPDMTARVFVDTAEGRMYRSGDLGRWSAQGCLVLEGRIDQQVKLHGQRIEPAEIEQTLQSHPDVRQASVIVDKGAGETKLLRGFVQLVENAALRSNTNWRDFLAGRLPPHMVPATIMAVPSIPYTPNGKLDRKQLLAAFHENEDVQIAPPTRTPPLDPLEIAVAEVWAALLGGGDPSGPPIAREDNFFALGGDSLLAITMAQHLLRRLGTPVSARDLFAAPTLAEFAARIATASQIGRAAGAFDLTLATEGEVEFWTAQQAELETSGHIALTVRQLAGPVPERAAWDAAWTKLVARQEGLRTFFVGGADDQLRRQTYLADSDQMANGTGLEWGEVADIDAALRLIRARQLAPFDMSRPPLWRGGLVRIAGTDQWLFWLALHHAIGDGRSLGVIMGELARLLAGQQLPPLSASPGAMVERELAYFAAPDAAEDAQWWSREIKAAPDRAFAPLTLDYPRDIDAGVATHRFRTILPIDLSQALRGVAKRHSTSLYTVLLSLIAMEARQREGRDWLVLGTSVSTQENADEIELVSYGVNLVPLFLHVGGLTSVAHLLETCQQTLSGALQHARLPFTRICNAAWAERPALRDPLRFPLFDIAVTENPPAADFGLPLHFDRLAADDNPYEQTESAHGQDIVLVHESLPDGSIALEWHANAKLFSRERAADWFEGIQHWAAVLASHDDLAVLSLPGGSDGSTFEVEAVAASDKAPPRPGMEQQIAALWAEILNSPSPTRSDNFFALGGNSLLAITMAHRLTALLDRPVVARDLFAAPLLSDFATRLEGVRGSAAVGPTRDGCLATEGEQEFWTAARAGLDTSGHIMPLIRRISGPLAPEDRWQAAWSKLVARHPALRCRFAETADGLLVREFLQPGDIAQAFEWSKAADATAALDHIRTRQSAPMDLACAPLWRAGVVELADGTPPLFWLAQHHATGDGRSIGVLLGELQALLAGESLAPLSETPESISAREQSYLAAEASADSRWWAERLRRLPASAFEDWVTDLPRSMNTAGSHHYATRLSATDVDALLVVARRHAASLHAVLLALLARTVERRTGRRSFMIGTTATVPESAAEAAVVHYGVNMLPLGFEMRSDAGFEALLCQTRDELNEALARSRFPFSRIYQEFRKARPGGNDPGRYPLFDIAVTENPVSAKVRSKMHFEQVAPFADLALSKDVIHYELMANPPGQDMVLTYQRLEDGGMLLDWQMNAALYHRDIGQFWIEGLAQSVRWLAMRSPTETDLPHLLPTEADTLANWGAGPVKPLPEGTFANLFESVVDRPGQADRPALLTAKGEVSYRELDRQANRLSHRLIAAGLRPGQVVAVLTGRSPRLATTMLAIWKAGGIYLPLMASLPPERLAFMARDSAASLLLVLDAITPPPGIDLPVVIDSPAEPGPDHRPGIAGTGQDHAYILYTSGSTGQPKGVALRHAGYINLVLGSVSGFGLTWDDRCLGFAAPSFDVSLSDVGSPLAAGAAFYPLLEDTLSQPSRVAEVLARQQITLADLPPSYLRLLDDDCLAGLRILVTGGEAPLPGDVARLAGKLAYYNAYGATEASITSTMGRLSPDQADGLDCGHPLPNTGVELRDPDTERPVPPGAIGEIWLSGHGLGNAYLNRPDLTAQAFIETDQGLRYRTGDLARWRGGGRLELLGRIDLQVKLNGIRIELGEIEAAIAAHPAVSQAVALVAGNALERQTLWAFVVPASSTMPSQAELKGWLGNRLPGYMVPSGLHTVSAIPMTPSGKIDRETLLAELGEQRLAPVGGTAPKPGLEHSIADRWSALLGCGPVHREDNFFSLGGHSLLAIALCHDLETRLGRQIPVHWLFAAPVLADFADRVAADDDNPVGAVMLPIGDLATEGEREFWVAEKAGLDASSFTMTLTLAVEGSVPDDEAWQSAWSALAMRHDALRTSFRPDADGLTLRRVVCDDVSAPFTASTAADRAAAQAAIGQAQRAPFAMEQGPLGRAGLVRTADGAAIFWLALHHSIGDGVSLTVLVRDLARLLNGEALPAAVRHYADHAAGEHAYLAGPAAAQDSEWWRARLAEAGEDSFEPLPSDRPHLSVNARLADKGTHVVRTLVPAEQARRLRQIARDQGATMHAVMLALAGLEVKRRTRRNAFILGTAVSTRASAAEADVVGYFVNQVPVPFDLSEVGSPADAIAQAQSMLAGILAHSSYPFARIVRDVRADHPCIAGRSGHPLFSLAVTENPALEQVSAQSVLRFVATAQGAAPAAGVCSYYASPNRAPQDMLLVHEAMADGSLALSWLVDASLHDRGSTEAWLAGLAGSLVTLSELGADKHLPGLLPFELAQIERWERGETLAPPAATLAELFGLHAAAGPDRPAIVADGASRSYAQVERAAGVLAAVLRQQGVGRGSKVGVFTERSISLPIVVMAIWQAGGCYVPLVEGLPEERLVFTVGDAGIEILLVLDGLTAPDKLLAAVATVLHLGAEPWVPVPVIGAHCVPVSGSALDPAIILYTSGSTGTPKGVVMSHAGVMNLALGLAEAVGFGDQDRLLSVTSPSFDLWLSDLVSVWAVGGAFIPATREEIEDLDVMRGKITRLGATFVTMTPSYLRMFEQDDMPGLRGLMTVGEPPVMTDARFYASRLNYYNGYGPTENSAATSIGLLNPDDDPQAAGRPLTNQFIMILDEDGQRVPPGSCGEAWLGGESLALGYANNSDLTAEVFVESPFGRMYRSGDLARWRDDGQLVVLGRVDGQVKLRGQRVELGEIEMALLAHPLVKEAAAVVGTSADGNQVLWAFVVPASEEGEWPSHPDWKAFLGSTLPSYMVPASIVRLVEIPKTPSGKTDRKALASRIASIPADASAEREHLPPVGQIESIVAETWATTLGRDLPSRRDSFFELGGDSLKAIAVITRLRQRFDLQINDLYEHPVLEDFALCCKSRPARIGDRLAAAAAHWRDYRNNLASYDAERDSVLALAAAAYAQRNRAFDDADFSRRADYRNVLLTGATGYVGIYLLRQLLQSDREQVTALVRARNSAEARVRLVDAFGHYFGAKEAERLGRDNRLVALPGDLRQADLGLGQVGFDQLAEQSDAIFHSAANVRHFGHYRDFEADNVDATRHLIELAARRGASHAGATADFNLVSTVSVFGAAPEHGFRLFTEYDTAPDLPDRNYYIRSKQEAERLALRARDRIANSSIHRVGNTVFSADGVKLQRNIRDNAFFRMLAALVRLGVVPDDSHLWLCHVDVVAEAIVALAETPALASLTHHIEHARRDSLAGFVTSAPSIAGTVRAVDFEEFIACVIAALDQPGLETALSEILESFGLLRGVSPQAGGRRLEVCSERTQQFLARVGVVWPEIPVLGQDAMLAAAQEVHP